MIAKPTARCLTILVSLLAVGCTQTIEPTGTTSTVRDLDQKAPGRYVAVLNVTPEKTSQVSLMNPKALIQSLEKHLCVLKLAFAPTLEKLMKLAVEAVFEDVVFVPKSDAPINIQDFNADGGISVTLTQAKPYAFCSGRTCNARMDFTVKTVVSRPNQPKVEIETSRGESESDTSWLDHCLMVPGLMQEVQKRAIEGIQSELVEMLSEKSSLFGRSKW